MPPAELDAEWYLERDPEALTANIVLVSYRCEPESLVDTWRSQIGDIPQNFAIVAPGESMASENGSTSDQHDIPVTRPARADLATIGTTVSDYLTRWADDNPTTVWVDSITQIVDTVGLETTFRFCHLLTGQVRRGGAVGYYQLDPPSHDTHTVVTLTPLFDTVIE